MRTVFGVVRGLQSSPVPLSAWARQLRTTARTLQRIVSGERRVQHGPVMQRLQAMFTELDGGAAEWCRTGVDAHGRACWEYRGRAGAPQAVYRVDFLRQALGRGVPA